MSKRNRISPVEETVCLPMSLSHTIRLPLLLHTKHTVVHLYTYTHLEKKKFVRIIPPLSYYLPALSIERDNHIDCAQHAFLDSDLQHPLPLLTILVVHTLSFHALFASVRSLFGNDSVLCGEAV